MCFNAIIFYLCLYTMYNMQHKLAVGQDTGSVSPVKAHLLFALCSSAVVVKKLKHSRSLGLDHKTFLLKLKYCVHS